MLPESTYSEFEMSAIQEVANIGTGNAATALSQMVGQSVNIDVPNAIFVTLQEAAELIGPIESPVFAVLTPIVGDVPASILLVLPEEAAIKLCGMLGTDPYDEMGQSALQEIGNILTGSYVTAIASMTNLALEPDPPGLAIDMLGAVVDVVLAMAVLASDTVLFMQTAMHVGGEACDFGFLYVPQEGSVEILLRALGVS
jgi:chemotaxis protein CheC